MMSGIRLLGVLLIVFSLLIFAYVGYTLLSKETTTTTIVETSTVKKKPITGKAGKTKPPKTKTPPVETTGVPSPTKSPPPTESSSPTKSSQPKYETGFFLYKWVKYRITTRGQTFTYKFENAGVENVNGRPCYHTKVTVEGPQKAEMEIWYDKETLQCVKVAITIPGAGTKEMSCSSAEQSIPISSEKKETMKYVGEEIVTVPAGTFKCWVFEGEGFRSWVSEDLQLLVKWEGQGSKGELLGYG